MSGNTGCPQGASQLWTTRVRADRRPRALSTTKPYGQPCTICVRRPQGSTYRSQFRVQMDGATSVLRSRPFASTIACIALASVSCMRAAASPTQCQPDEEQLFACSTGKKILAVCASRNWSASAGSLEYRYGTPGSAELVLPRAPHSRRQAHRRAC